MSLATYGYRPTETIACVGCGCKITGGWRCERCATDAMASAPPPSEWVNPHVDRGQFQIAAKVGLEVFGPYYPSGDGS